MKKMRYVMNKDIVMFIKNRNLKNVIIETGEENYFYPEENRFVLNWYNTQEAFNLLEDCDCLETVDFTNFDFSNTKSLGKWFYGCSNLKEIIFPKNVVCKKLFNLRRCFKGNAIKEIDFSSWIFEKTIDMREFVVDCPLLESVKLPEMKVDDATQVINKCESLTTIEAPIEVTPQAPIKYVVSHCDSLKLLDVSKAKLDNVKTSQEVLLSDENLYNIPDNCVVLV